MKSAPGRVWGWAAALLVWIAGWAAAGGAVGAGVLLHWPLALVLLFGFAFNLRGGLAAAVTASAVVIALKIAGTMPDWTLVGWQVLLFGLFGLYPFKFIQIREQRHHHYRTLIEYKRGEMEQLRSRLADVDRQVRELETRVRGGGAS